MYSRCLYCHGALGTNDLVEHLPVGRRLAFDTARGRLWVVCGSCARWNLTPLAERWEAIEECERAFRGTRLRVSTDNVGLAQPREGMELVRIGEARRPELAAWRYGRRFLRRRRKALTRGVMAAVALVATAPLVGGLPAAWVGAGAGIATVAGEALLVAVARRRGRLLPVRVHAARGRVLDVEPGFASLCRIRQGVSPSGWELYIPARPDAEILTGDAAVRALGLLLPHANHAGATAGDVRKAVDEIEPLADPSAYFALAEARARRAGWGYASVGQWPRPLRLAMEMVANEEEERQYLRGELVELERAWRDAEELAAIADTLALPRGIEDALSELKRSLPLEPGRTPP